MSKYIVTKMSKDEAEAIKELKDLVKSMILVRIRKASFELQEIRLIYIPYLIEEYEIENSSVAKKKLQGKIYASVSAGESTVKAFYEMDTLESVEEELEEKLVAEINVDRVQMEEIIRKELLFRILPRNLKIWKAHEMKKNSSVLIYRPLWAIRYRLFGRMKVYKTFGDKYNL